MTYRTATILTAALTAALGTAALAGPVHFEGFEDPGFTPGGDNWNEITGTFGRVTTGTGGIASKTGAAHAAFTALDGGNSSAFTRFDGYSSNFGGGFTASLDVYLDTTWTQGQGFDYTVAANTQADAHLRDFMFHVGVTDLGLIVNGSNNTDAQFNEFKLETENGGNYYTVANSGWYTLEQDFYDDAGTLSVDLNLYDASGTEVWSVTRTTSDDIASVVGGNRYGWFTYNSVEGLAVDNTSLVPEPGSLALLGLGGLALLRRRR